MNNPDSINVAAADSNVVSLRPEIPNNPDSLSSIPDGYELHSDGIHYHLPHDADDGEEKEPIYVCTPMRVDGLFHDIESKGWGRLVSVKTVDGLWHEVPVLDAELFRRATNSIADLVDHGLALGNDKKAKELLLALLKQWKPKKRLLSVDQPGWVDEKYDTFMVGSKVIGAQDVLPPAVSRNLRTGLTARGTVEDWKAHVAMKCQGNPLMILAVSLAFSGPLLAPLGMHGGGLHFRGSSSSGKSTLLKLAASVWGGEQLIGSWNTTTNGLEAIAGPMSDMMLPMDELGQIAARDLTGAIYLVANGIGKSRMTTGGRSADQARWQLALISSGEITVKEKLSEVDKEAMDGLEMRLIDIEADSRKFGAFDNLHGAANAAAFADSIQKAAQSYHGLAGLAFVRKLVSADGPDVCAIARSTAKKISSDFLGRVANFNDGQTSRVARRFAIISAAGELATRCGLTGWKEGDAVGSARQAFLDWHEGRYRDKQDAVNAVVKPLQEFLAANLASLPDVKDPHVDGDDPSGWRDATRVYLQKDTWASIYPGDDGKNAASALRDMKMLVPGEGSHLQRKAPRTISGRPRLYTLNTEQVMAYKIA